MFCVDAMNQSLMGVTAASNQDSTSTSTSTSPEKFSLPDGIIEGTVSSNTVSPRTLPSSTDENFQLDESWPQFQLFNAAAVGMPIETPPLMYPFAKEPTDSNNTVIVDDVGELSSAQGFSPEFQSGEFMPFPSMPSAYPFVNEPWTETSTPTAPENLPVPQAQTAFSMEPQLASKDANPLRDFQGSMRPHESRWLDGLETQLPTAMPTPSAFSAVPHDLSFHKNGLQGQDQFQYKSESSSVSEDAPGAYEGSYSATSDEIPTFAERQLDEDGQLKDQRSGDASSQPSQSTTAFMVSETPSESFLVSNPSSRPRASSAAQRPSAARPTPFAVQSVATVRKRKPRSSNLSVDQGQQKPLQIVQEDGQGGSVASADFVSPPRGARRKGPLSMVGRANAGMRRKNKDTCVQCRLNKRKVLSLPSFPQDAC